MTPQATSPALPTGFNIVGLAYDFGPKGATFSPPITMTFDFTPANIPAGVPETSLVVAFYNTTIGQWVTRTVQLQHVCLHKALDNAVRIGLIPRNPCDSVDQPRIERRAMKTMTEDNITQFLNEARKTDYYTLFFLLLFTGMRRGEALSLRWGDIDLTGAQLSINRNMQCIKGKISFKSPKTASSRRRLDLSPNTCTVLRLHKEK